MKRILKWFLIAVLLVVVLAVIFLLSLDSIVRVVAQKRIRAQTGMVAEIGKFHVGLLEPVVTIKDLKLHNPPAFGGGTFLNIPEIHIEYDRDALRKNQIHITLMRFNLGELDIVKSEAGQTNIFALGVAVPAKNAPAGRDLKEFKSRTGLEFKGIDVLQVSVGTMKFIDLKDPSNNREQKIGIENFVITKTPTKDYGVKSLADLTGLEVYVGIRGEDFFKSAFGVDDKLKWLGAF